MEDTTQPRYAPHERLSDKHYAELTEASGIDPEIVAERGYRTIERRAELTEYPNWQRRLGLYVPMYSPDGVSTGCQLKPGRRRPKGPKYETPQGSQMIADVHPRMRDQVRNGSGPLLITEGIKTGDAATSRGLPTVALPGVWMWKVKGTHADLLPCFGPVNLDRQVLIAFDADVMSKGGVQQALGRLVEALEARGADVYVVYLPDLGDGKTGVDDFLAAGHTLSEMKMLARRFEPQDISRIRLTKDAELRAAIEAAWTSWESFNWNRLVGTGKRPHWQRGHSARDVESVAIEQAARSGVLVEDGLFFRLDQRTWAERCTTNKDKIAKYISHLEAEDRLRRVEEPDKPEEQAAAYVLLVERATYVQVERKGEREGEFQGGYDPGVRRLRAPRLRWGRPTFEREGDEVYRGFIRRVGKHNAAIIDFLDSVGGSASDVEVAEALGKAGRERDLRNRNFVRLEERGIVETSEGGRHVALVDDWPEALEREREVSGEIADARRQRAQHQREREAYRNRDSKEADPSPSQEEMDARREAREQQRRDLAVEAFSRPRTGAQMNLRHWINGDLDDPEILTRSVLRTLGIAWSHEHDFREVAVAVANEHREGPDVAAPERTKQPRPKRSTTPPPDSGPDYAPDEEAPLPPDPELDSVGLEDDPCTGALDCECIACSIPAPRFAKPYGGAA